jgi:hypothetical protein
VIADGEFPWREQIRAQKRAFIRLKFDKMPTIKRVGPYRFYFYSHEPNEPAHIHVDRDRFSAKFWLRPVSLVCNLGFRPAELNHIFGLVEEYQQECLEAWHEFFRTESR